MKSFWLDDESYCANNSRILSTTIASRERTGKPSTRLVSSERYSGGGGFLTEMSSKSQNVFLGGEIEES